MHLREHPAMMSFLGDIYEQLFNHNLKVIAQIVADQES